jgi:predicted phosphodiesterase
MKTDKTHENNHPHLSLTRTAAAALSFAAVALLLTAATPLLLFPSAFGIEDNNKNNNNDNIPITTAVSLTDGNNDGSSSTTSAALPDWNFAAAGDWDCRTDTTNTVNNIVNKDPELVLGLGDYPYTDTNADCWLDIIEPIDSKMKIVIGNHDYEVPGILNQLMDHFNLEKQYYSFNYQNVHFLALSTDISGRPGSTQYNFVKNDLADAASNSSIDWIVVYTHRHLYTSPAKIEPWEGYRDAWHPLFDQYGVDLVLQGHIHNYQRTYPLKFNSDDSDEPIVTDKNTSMYSDPENPIFIIAGLGGVSYIHDFTGDQAEFVAKQFNDRNYGFLNVEVINDGHTLRGTYYANKDLGSGLILDSFTINKTVLSPPKLLQ